MVIGIIGASLSGLIAGEKLAKAGHDVTIIEKNRTLGGRLATQGTASDFFDYGLPYIDATEDTFKRFVDLLVSKNVLSPWTDDFLFYDGTHIHKTNPNKAPHPHFAGRNGINAVAQHLTRWVDIKPNAKAGGLTYLGADRTKKRAWMINLTDRSLFECDAVILATPAAEAYGLLNTAQDETPILRIIRVIDELRYHPLYALASRYDEPAPDWKGIVCDGPLSWIGNDTSKHADPAEGSTNLTIHSSPAFARANAGKDEKAVTHALLEEAVSVVDPWLKRPRQTTLHFWKYYRAMNPLKESFMELEMEEAPLALVGDYFNNNTAEAAYLSGYELAEYWINKFAPVSA